MIPLELFDYLSIPIDSRYKKADHLEDRFFDTINFDKNDEESRLGKGWNLLVFKAFDSEISYLMASKKMDVRVKKCPKTTLFRKDAKIQVQNNYFWSKKKNFLKEQRNSIRVGNGSGVNGLLLIIA